ncbi:MAG: hypothetical protein PHE60_07420 [Sulfurospirillaceae bacterium]|nr:hypothetical protein [Sulfurospirillaceae bacterium]
MNDQQLLTLFIGIIMVCMVIIAAAIVFLTIKHITAMHKATAFIALSQNELSGFCQKATFMLDDVSDLIATLEEKSHFLALKASGSIAQLTHVTTAIKTFSQLFKSTPKEDTMNQNNLLSFALGATITGISAYYVYKNKDEITSKLNDLEETLVDDYEILVEKAKAKFEALSHAFQETTQGLLHTDVEDVMKGSEIKHLMKKLDKLQKEIQVLTKG